MPNSKSTLRQMRDACNTFADRIDSTTQELGDAPGHPDCGAHSCLVKASFANSAGTGMVLRSKAFDYEREIEEIEEKRSAISGVVVRVASSGAVAFFSAMAAVIAAGYFGGR